MVMTSIRSEGPFTVFAPTDEAFAALPEKDGSLLRCSYRFPSQSR
ncbi:MAG: fasciclin domain-containing protein [Cyanobacteria bacterium P01_G01_bin.38]